MVPLSMMDNIDSVFFLLSSSVWVTNYFYVALFYKIFFEDRHLFSLNHVLCVTILFI